MTEMMNDSHSKIIDSTGEVKAITLSTQSAASAMKKDKGGDEKSGAYHCYGGKYSRLPQGWVFPKLKL